MTHCPHCGVLFQETITFSSSCDRCGQSLHCCVGCAFYAPGRANDCLVPGTDSISDREKKNFCEEFSPKKESGVSEKRKTYDEALERAKKLFE